MESLHESSLNIKQTAEEVHQAIGNEDVEKVNIHLWSLNTLFEEYKINHFDYLKTLSNKDERDEARHRFKATDITVKYTTEEAQRFLCNRKPLDIGEDTTMKTSSHMQLYREVDVKMEVPPFHTTHQAGSSLHGILSCDVAKAEVSPNDEKTSVKSKAFSQRTRDTTVKSAHSQHTKGASVKSEAVSQRTRSYSVKSEDISQRTRRTSVKSEIPSKHSDRSMSRSQARYRCTGTPSMCSAASSNVSYREIAHREHMEIVRMNQEIEVEKKELVRKQEDEERELKRRHEDERMRLKSIKQHRELQIEQKFIEEEKMAARYDTRSVDDNDADGISQKISRIDIHGERSTELPIRHHESIKYDKPNLREPLRSNISCVTHRDQQNTSHGKQTSESLSLNNMIDILQAPPAEVIKFDGNPLQYHLFMKSFDNAVDSRPLDDCAKLTRLVTYCAGEAKELVQSCMIMTPTEGYLQARRLLHKRYGDEYTITKVWTDKILRRQALKSKDPTALRKYADDLQACKLTLDALGPSSKAEMNTNMNMLLIVEKLPNYLQNRWRAYVQDIKQRRHPVFDDIVTFIEKAAEEANDPVFGHCGVERIQQTTYLTNPQSAHPTVSNKRCFVCQENHYIFWCPVFKNMKPVERLDFATEKDLCINCLKPGHKNSDCRSERICSVENCGRKHSIYLHVDDQGLQKSTAVASVTSKATGTGSESAVALPVLKVKVMAGGRSFNTYALLDNASASTFCSTYLVNQLGLVGSEAEIKLTTLECANSDTKTSVVSMCVSDTDNNTTVQLENVYTREKIPIQRENIAEPEDIQRWTHLKHLPVIGCSVKKVDLLIGQDYPELLLPQEIISGKHREPYAVKTVLGWTINGPIGLKRKQAAVSHFTSLEQQVERFWTIDSTEILDGPKISANDNKVLQLWERTTRHENGHYVMNIPFKEKNLPLNRPLAEKRLQALRRRLLGDEKLKKRYSDAMEDLLTKGYAERVNKKDKPAQWFLPHHPVFNAHKPDKN